MTGGIIGTVGRVLGYLLLIISSVVIITMLVVILTQYQNQNPQESVRAAFRSVRSAVREMRGQGEIVGRAVPGVDPPSIPERLALLASSQNIVTPTQEVIMTGNSATYTCLGGDNEVMIEILNDIGSDQLDISYSLENNEANLPVRNIKVASCGPRSTVKQCIPAERNIKLHILAYYYDSGELPKSEKGIREEKRIYPDTLNKASLKSLSVSGINASAFVPVEE